MVPMVVGLCGAEKTYCIELLYKTLNSAFISNKHVISNRTYFVYCTLTIKTKELILSFEAVNFPIETNTQ